MNELSRIVAQPMATSSTTDQELLKSWVQSLHSEHSRRNFEQTAQAFLAGLPMGLRSATVEDVRTSLDCLSVGLAESTTRQYVLRIKSLLSYAKQLGYTMFDAGAVIKVRSEGNRGARLSKRIVAEMDVALLIRSTETPRHKVLLQTLYAGGLRVSEAVALNWSDVIERGDGVQLCVTGKGGKVRNVLLPLEVSNALRLMRGDPNSPVFVGRYGERLTTRAVHAMVKRAAENAGVTTALSPHWLRHAHGSHSLDRGATLAEVQETLGHANVATTSGYLHARPHSSSGLKLDPGVFGSGPESSPQSEA